jgi:hypothetical protein
MNLKNLGKLVGMAGDMGSNNSKDSGIMSLVSMAIGTAFPPAGMILGILSSTGIMDTLTQKHPEEAEQLKDQIDKFEEAMNEILKQAKNIDRYVDHLSDAQVDDKGKKSGYF